MLKPGNLLFLYSSGDDSLDLAHPLPIAITHLTRNSTIQQLSYLSLPTIAAQSSASCSNAHALLVIGLRLTTRLSPLIFLQAATRDREAESSSETYGTRYLLANNGVINCSPTRSYTGQM